MTDFFTFVNSLFDSLAAFLMTEPIKWFIGIFLIVAVAGLVRKILTL